MDRAWKPLLPSYLIGHIGERKYRGNVSCDGLYEDESH